MLTIQIDLTLPLGYPDPTTQTTLRSLITKHAEITAVPRKSFIELLSHFTTDQLETDKLREFCTPEGQVCLISKGFVGYSQISAI